MSPLENKIAGLLAKAEGTDNPIEAETFMAKAEELMLKHGIDRAKLEAKPGSKREDIVQVRIHIKNGHGYGIAMKQVAFSVAPSFSVRCLQSSMYNGDIMVWLIGYKSDVDQAQTLATSLMEQSRTQALHWWKTEGKASFPYYTDNDAYLARREFIFAFASGVRGRLEETRNRVADEAGTGTALVLVERLQQVSNWMDENMNVKDGRATRRNYGDRAAAQAGKQAGRDAVSPKEVR
jgi:hypothetical protein